MVMNPITQFSQWYDEALNSSAINPTAVALATATAEGQPSVRMVLLKGFDDRGFVFYTNLTSRKAMDLSHNPLAALCFYWPGLDKQIRVEGGVLPVSDEEADQYFATRSRESQLAALASKQSQVIPSFDEFDQRLQKYTDRYQDKPVPRPIFWSGFRLVPTMIEFWKAGEHRLHDRVCYLKNEQGNWVSHHLYP